jgi:hypothetical protein
MAGFLLKGLSPDVMIMIMQLLPNFAALHDLLAADPDLEPLHACYQQSIDTAIAKNLVGRSQWSAVRALITTQYPYRQPAGVLPLSPTTFTALEVGIFEETIRRMGLWHTTMILRPRPQLNLTELALYQLWTLMWVCVPEVKDLSAEVRDRVAGGEPWAFFRVKSLRKKEAAEKTPEYMCRYSKIEKFFEVYRSGGERGKRELKELFKMSLHSLTAVLFMPELIEVMQVPAGCLQELYLKVTLAEIVRAHIVYTASLLKASLY